MSQTTKIRQTNCLIMTRKKTLQTNFSFDRSESYPCFQLCKTLKHVTGCSDADWAGDLVTRTSTSCALRHVDQFLLTSECRGQGTVALSTGESELYALGALSAELIFAQAILKEIGLSLTAAQHAQWQRNKERVAR